MVSCSTFSIALVPGSACHLRALGGNAGSRGILRTLRLPGRRRCAGPVGRPIPQLPQKATRHGRIGFLQFDRRSGPWRRRLPNGRGSDCGTHRTGGLVILTRITARHSTASATSAEGGAPRSNRWPSIPTTISLLGRRSRARASSIASATPRACVEQRNWQAGSGKVRASQWVMVPGGAPASRRPR